MPRTTPTQAPDASQPLGALTPPRHYQAPRQHVFPSFESLRWFIRRNRALLIERGAITAPAGTVLINEDAFDEVVLDIGKQRMADPTPPAPPRRRRAADTIEIAA